MLSDLVYAGDINFEDLDDLEETLIKVIPTMNKLTQIDLSTHLRKVSSDFPSVVIFFLIYLLKI